MYIVAKRSRDPANPTSAERPFGHHNWCFESSQSSKIGASRFSRRPRHGCSKTLWKRQDVRIPCPPLRNHAFPWKNRTSCEFSRTLVAPMQLGAWRLRRCISRRAPQIESLFASRESPKHWAIACRPMMLEVVAKAGDSNAAQGF